MSEPTRDVAEPRSGARSEPHQRKVHPDGSLVQMDPGDWFGCFPPGIDEQWWYPFVHERHEHVFAMRPAGDGKWTLFEPWWMRLLTATITEEQARKFLRWGALGDVLLLREAVPGSGSRLRGWRSRAALAAYLPGARIGCGRRMPSTSGCCASPMSAMSMSRRCSNGISRNSARAGRAPSPPARSAGPTIRSPVPAHASPSARTAAATGRAAAGRSAEPIGRIRSAETGHRLGHARPRAELARAAPEVRMIDEAPQIAREMAEIDRIEAQEGRERAPVGLGEARARG